MKTRHCFMPLTIYYRKNSFLASLFDEKILHLTQNGFMGKWARQFVSNKLLRPDKMIKYVYQEPRKLSFIQIEGALMICGCLHIIAMCIFVFEIIFKKFYY